MVIFLPLFYLAKVLVKSVELSRFERGFLNTVQASRKENRRIVREGWYFTPRLSGVLVKFYRTPATTLYFRRGVIEDIPYVRS